MKKLIAATTLSLGLIGLSACGGGSSENVAETKAGNITKDELYEDMLSSVGGESLKKLITLKVLEDKYDVSDEDIDKELDDLKEQVGEDFDQVLAMQGRSEERRVGKEYRYRISQERRKEEEMIEEVGHGA